MERCELHLHTQYSPDSNMKLADVMTACKQRSITTLFVTDHNDIEGALRLQELAPFRVIPSEEITTSGGELIGYFLTQRIRPYQSPEATIEAIRKQGGVVSVPHPFDRLRHSAIRRDALERIIPLVDMLEVFNSRNVFPFDDVQARSYAHTHNKAMIAVSDAHTRREVGRSTVEVEDFSTPEEFLSRLGSAQLFCSRSPFYVHVLTKLQKIKTRLGLASPPDKK